MSPPLLLIAGPTASGKTKLAVELALRLDAEIISADSMQIYRGLSVGTAQPTPEELRGIPCHLIRCIEPTQTWSVADWHRQATQLIQQIHDRGKCAIIAGGTGLYFKTLDGGLFHLPQNMENKHLRQELEKCWEPDNGKRLREELRQVDPQAHSRIHHNDRLRIIRALEVFRATGRPLSEWQHSARGQYVPPQAMRFVLSAQRQLLYKRIDERVQQMMQNGFPQEVQRLLGEGASDDWPAMRALGYSPLCKWARNQCTLEEAILDTQKSSRNYAKRQLVLLRQWAGSIWLDSVCGAKINASMVEKILEFDLHDGF